MASAAVLYTPEVLALATSLARFPMDEALEYRGSARSTSCGSTLTMGLSLDSEGAIARIGLAAHACAIGQAAAAIFADHAVGLLARDIVEAEAAIRNWLSGEAAEPAWPGLETMEVAAAYPARHGAILLAWRAALAALSSGGGDV